MDGTSQKPCYRCNLCATVKCIQVLCALIFFYKFSTLALYKLLMALLAYLVTKPNIKLLLPKTRTQPSSMVTFLSKIATWWPLNSIQLNSTENYGRSCLTPLSPHRHCILAYEQYHFTTSSDRFPVPVRSAVKSNFTNRCRQNLSKRALNALTVQASTTELGKLFQIFTMRAEKMLS